MSCFSRFPATLALLGALIFFHSPVANCAQTNRPAGVVAVWGQNIYGTNMPMGLTNVIAISVGASNVLALNADGTVTAWGHNAFGQATVPPGLSGVVEVAAGTLHSLALRSDGKVVAWGESVGGATNVPANLSNVIAIAAGYRYSMALKADGTVANWGSGQLIIPASLKDVTMIAGGGTHEVALTKSNTIVCWGAGGSVVTNVPSAVTNLPVLAVAAGQGFSMALRADGTVAQWGTGPSAVPSWSNTVAISAGSLLGTGSNSRHHLRIQTDGSIAGWASAATSATNVPPDLPPALAIGAGAGFSVALLSGEVPPMQPSIISQPVSRLVAVGSTVTFTVLASGSAPLTYQWLRDGTNVLAGATNTLLSLTNVHVTDSGEYSVMVSNSAGMMLSQPALLTVLPMLDIATAPLIRIYGDVGATYNLDYLEAVGPPQVWTTLATFVLTNSPHLYIDFPAAGMPRRFYRAVQLP